MYRGRSLFPQGIAHQKFTNGVVYAIDPYDNLAAIQKDKPDLQEILDDFAANTDFSKIYNEVTAVTKQFSIDKNCTFLKTTSHEAVKYFLDNNIKLGLIHIDGNHDTHFVMQDVEDYYPILEKDGTIVLDDVSWNSVKPAFDFLNERMKFIGKCIDDQNDFAVFINAVSKATINSAQLLFESLIKKK